MAAVECMELGRRFGQVVAVEDLSLIVEEGEFFALLGPNGAGKTTTLHMLTTLLEPSSGSARVVGFDVVTQSRDVRAALGMVFQEPAVDERLTARENLEIHSVLYRIPRAQRRERVADALEWAALGGVDRRLVRTFSGGMRRRLELARALMHEPRILFLDEPTRGLDPQGRRDLWVRIAELRSKGLTVVMTTHYLTEAEACDRIGIVDHGRLIALGTPGQLKESARVDPAGSLEDVFIELTGRHLRDDVAGPRDRLLSFGRRGGEHTR